MGCGVDGDRIPRLADWVAVVVEVGVEAGRAEVADETEAERGGENMSEGRYMWAAFLLGDGVRV